MDPATLIGIVVAFGALLAMLTIEGSSVTAILLPAPMVLVFGATIAVGIAGGTILGDGNVALIVDVQGLKTSALHKNAA